MSTPLPKIELLALCFELPSLDVDAPLPEWLPMIPGGAFSGRDGRSWVNDDPQSVIAASLRYPKLPFDIEHATEIKGPKGEEAPAYAWIDALRVNDDGSIDARVTWTPDGEALIRGRKYIYYSPAFFNNAAGRVTRLSSAGLTNKPNLNLPALNQEKNEMTVPVQIVTVLGLAAAASAEDVVVAIQQMKDRETVALNRAENPDLSKFIPAETYQLALNRAQTAEEKLQALDEKAAQTLVDAAIADGKVAPANRDMYLATCRSEAGREQFASFVKTAPALINTDPSKGKDNQSDAPLNETELAMCRSMGVSQEEFLAIRNKEGAR